MVFVFQIKDLVWFQMFLYFLFQFFLVRFQFFFMKHLFIPCIDGLKIIDIIKYLNTLSIKCLSLNVSTREKAFLYKNSNG